MVTVGHLSQTGRDVGGGIECQCLFDFPCDPRLPAREELHLVVEIVDAQDLFGEIPHLRRRSPSVQADHPLEHGGISYFDLGKVREERSELGVSRLLGHGTQGVVTSPFGFEYTVEQGFEVRVHKTTS